MPPPPPASPLAWVRDALLQDGFAVVPAAIPAAHCDELRRAYARSLASMPSQREGGMVNMYFLPEKECLVMGSPRIHSAFTAAYGDRARGGELGVQMHERMNRKAPGNAAQELHVDLVSDDFQVTLLSSDVERGGAILSCGETVECALVETREGEYPVPS